LYIKILFVPYRQQLIYVDMFKRLRKLYTKNLLPCDHEVMGSSSENSLLQKYKKRLRT
jgi:hypothetical protein